MGKAVVMAGALGAAAVVVAAANFVIGGKVEAGFRSSVDAMCAGALQVQVLDYRRGVFGAEARTTWTIDDGDETITFSVDHHIDQGVFAAGSAARIHSTLIMPAAFERSLGAVLQGRAALEVATVVGWRGDLFNRISSPGFKGAAGAGLSVDWGGIDGELNLGAGQSQARGRIVMPKLDIRDADGSALTIEHLAFDLDSSRSKQYRFWTGSSSLSLDRAVFSARSGQDSFVLGGLKIASLIALDGDLVNMSVDFRVSNLSGGGETVDELGLAFAAERIDAAALDAISRRAEEVRRADSDIEMQRVAVLEVVSQQLPAMLGRAPAIELKRLGASLGEGRAEMSARIDYAGKADAVGRDPVAGVGASAEFSMPKALLLRLLQLNARQSVVGYVQAMKVEASDAEIDGAVSAAVKKQMGDILAAGVLREKDGMLSTALRYEGGSLFVNGRPSPLSAIEALGLAL
ncbi:DUF945 family protein [Azoarcus sp. L1K30]|uniref:YdgA family protein n=1 Tax=Azoarcus sp. L1K30 TaxID=2820277 RepID=UPI001B810EEF|nr:DUF945 family protein [Azoarcus sp. L1K30]MBR0566400.1 DUF945 family protein [Azoarcus sp. L1K30]